MGRAWHAVLVAYPYNRDKSQAWESFVHALKIPLEQTFVVDNHHPAAHQAMQGTNRYFEFSGYHEALLELKNRGASKVIIVNDTLFSHHYVAGWKDLISRAMSKTDDRVLGDGRTEPVYLGGRPLEILASWLFILPGTGAISAFEQGLSQSLSMFDEAIEEPEYIAYQKRYLRARWMGGYTRKIQEESDEMWIKKRCIWAEHRLSRYLQEKQMFQRLVGKRYQLVHWVDRYLAFRRRLRSSFS